MIDLQRFREVVASFPSGVVVLTAFAGAEGGPILEEDAAAYAVCALRETIEAGDHWILLGLVIDGAHHEGMTPMIFSRRVYDALGGF